MTTSTWEKIDATGDIPSARDKHCSFVYKDQLYIFGGFGPQPEDPENDDSSVAFTWFNQLHCFNPINKTFQIVVSKGNCPPPVAAFGSAVLSHDKPTLYIFGGKTLKTRNNFLYSLDLDSMSWSLLAPKGAYPMPRSFCCCSAINKYLLVYGGASQNDMDLGDFHLYSPQLNLWIQPNSELGQPFVPSARRMASCAVLNQTCFVYGGTNSFNSEFFDQLLVLPLQTELENLSVSPPSSPETVDTTGEDEPNPKPTSKIV